MKFIKGKKLLNKKSLILQSMLFLVFCSVSAFASNLTERNVYGILSDNFTGAMQERGQSTDNIRFNTWAAKTAPTSAVIVDTATAKEGKKYMKFDCKGSAGAGSYSGCSYTFVGSNNTTAQSTDISHFRYLDFWIKNGQGNIKDLKIGVTANGADKTVSMATYVSSATTSWQHVVIDLNALGADLTKVTNTFLVICNNLTSDTIFYVDNIVLRTGSTSASFNANLKKIEDMQNVPENPTQITWKTSVFHNSWQSCGQYLELDMDMYSYAWTVRIYTNNGGSGRGGLYASLGSKDYVIPMSWRVYNGTLVNEVGSNKDTYLIKQSTKTHRNLYDYGKSPTGDPDYYPWLFFKDYSDIDFNDPVDVDYVTVWDSSLGYHGFSAANVGEGFYEFNTVNKKPRIYFGGDFNSAAGNITYLANIVIQLNYE